MALAVFFPIDAFAQIAISDEPLTENEIEAERPLVGYKAFSRHVLTSLDPKAGSWGIDTPVLYEVASKDHWFRQQENVTGRVADMDLETLMTTIKRRASASGTKTISESIPITFMGVQNETIINSDVIFSAIEKGAVNIDTRSEHRPEFTCITKLAVPTCSTLDTIVNVQKLKFDPVLVQNLSQIYEIVPSKNESQISRSTAFNMAEVVKISSSDSRFNDVYSKRLDNVTFGRPLSYTAEEKNLTLPSSITKEFDVYWIDFAVSSAAIDKTKASEFAFFVKMPAKYIALGLLPLRYGTEEKVSEKTAMPEVKVEAKGASVSLGEIYGQTVEYKRLRPTILATGLQESEFGWLIKDEMIDQGTKRFSAVVGVPKGSFAVSFSIFATAKITSWAGMQSDLVSTEPVITEMKLR